MKAFFNLILLFAFASTLSSCGYNTMVNKRENVDAAWANVENQYQRRAELIPNLVETVKGAANFEKETLTQVIEARSKASSIQLSGDDLTPENIQKYQQAQEQLSGALSRLLVTVERYPELKATQGFMQFQSQLEGTENRIAVERGRYNEVARDYNSYIQNFPQNLIAGWFDFEKKGYFEAREGSDVAPTVEF